MSDQEYKNPSHNMCISSIYLVTEHIWKSNSETDNPIDNFLNQDFLSRIKINLIYLYITTTTYWHYTGNVTWSSLILHDKSFAF